jgi:multidrug efflux pump subunit AcrB
MGALALQKQAEALIAATRGDPQIAFMFTLYRADTPQLFVDVDRQKAMQMGMAWTRYCVLA